MGWNDHVESFETECLDCGEIDTWVYWSDTGIARYSGDIGQLLGVADSVARHHKCPHCGSTNGQIIPDEDDYYYDDDDDEDEIKDGGDF